MFRGWRPPLVLTDVDLPHMDGLELTRAIREEDPDAAVIVRLGTMANQCADAADAVYRRSVRTICLRLGAYTVLEKSVNTDELLLATEGALYARQMARSQRGLLHQRWTAVRPITMVAELLAMYGGVFSLKHHGAARPACPAESPRTVPLAEPSAQLLGSPRKSADAHGQGQAVQCRWCGLSNRAQIKICWSCGLPADSNLSASQRRPPQVHLAGARWPFPVNETTIMIR